MRIGIFTLLFGFGIAGCGAAAGQERIDSCRQECGVGFMACIESESCTLPEGEVVPCEKECGERRDACERACGG